MSSTAEIVARMAQHMQLNLSEQEHAEITAMIKRTGSLAPERETVTQFLAGKLTSGALTFFLPSIWRYRPDDSTVPAEVWRAMFEHAEHTADMVVSPRSKRTVRAYRGATSANRDGLSWSLDVEQAAYFARSRQAPGTTAHVWVTNIPPERVHARFMNGWEKEITADVRGLDIRLLEDEHHLPRPRAWPWQR